MIARLTVLIFIILFSLTLTPSVNAVTVCPSGGFASAACGTLGDPSGISNIIQAGINVLFIVGTMAAIFFIIYGGIKWITSGGDKGAVEGAKQTISTAVIGLIIMFLSFLIIRLIATIFGIDPLNFLIPTITNPNGGF